MVLQEFTLPPVRRSLNSRSTRKTEVERKVRIKPMDPLQMCGKGTSVTQLFRVEETIERGRIHHLVFFDKHGWYCEHGKQCSAVGDVQKFTRKKF
jgi:ribosomal protein L31